MEGLDFLGADDATDKKDDKKGDKKKGGKDDKKDEKGGEHKKNWLLRPLLGPIPSAGVLAIGAGVLTGLGFAVKAIFFRRR